MFSVTRRATGPAEIPQHEQAAGAIKRRGVPAIRATRCASRLRTSAPPAGHPWRARTTRDEHTIRWMLPCGARVACGAFCVLMFAWCDAAGWQDAAYGMTHVCAHEGSERVAGRGERAERVARSCSLPMRWRGAADGWRALRCGGAACGAAPFSLCGQVAAPFFLTMRTRGASHCANVQDGWQRLYFSLYGDGALCCRWTVHGGSFLPVMRLSAVTRMGAC